MGAPAKLGKLVKASIIQINNEKITDATSKVVADVESKVTVEFKKDEIVDLPWTSHLIMFEFEGQIYINKTFEVKTAIVEQIGASVS